MDFLGSSYSLKWDFCIELKKPFFYSEIYFSLKTVSLGPKSLFISCLTYSIKWEIIICLKIMVKLSREKNWFYFSLSTVTRNPITLFIWLQSYSLKWEFFFDLKMGLSPYKEIHKFRDENLLLKNPCNFRDTKICEKISHLRL